MKQVLYLHGGESFLDHSDFLKRLEVMEIRDLPNSESFVKWTKTFAEDLGEEYEVFTPRMPNAQNAKYEEWKIWFERHFEHLRDGVILMGCSLGAMFLVRYFSESEVPFRVKALILMAAAINNADLEDEDGGDFYASAENLPKIATKAEQVIVMHSKDDFLVPFNHGEQLHAAIPSSEFIVFEDKNHFLIEEFPELIELITSVTKRA